MNIYNTFKSIFYDLEQLQTKNTSQEGRERRRSQMSSEVQHKMNQRTGKDLSDEHIIKIRPLKIEGSWSYPATSKHHNTVLDKRGL